jgi:hypothetical protein
LGYIVINKSGTKKKFFLIRKQLLRLILPVFRL